jgi:hypothetical protein
MNTLKANPNDIPVLDLDYKKLEDLELDGIDMRDYPDFCDAHIVSGYYDGRELTDDELDALNDDHDFVYGLVCKEIF